MSSDGFYRLYPLTASAGPSTSAGYSQHSLGTVAEDLGIMDAQIWEEGMVAMRGDLTFVEVKGWPPSEADFLEEVPEESFAQQADVFGDAHASTTRGGRIEALESPGINDPPACWAVIPPSVSSTRAAQVLVPRGSSVVTIDALDAVDQRLSRGPFVRIEPSPNGRFLALLTAHNSPRPGIVWVVSCDFSRELSEFDLKELGAQPDDEIEGMPSQMVWCGGDTVVLGWERTVLMIGPFGASLRWFYSAPVHLIGELDGVRIISPHICDFLSKVPPSTLSVFRPGSTSAAAILYDAYELFEKGSARADEHVRSIRADLVGAVDTCIEAAGKELEVGWQKRLLKAAGFGKTFLDGYNPDEFVAMGRTLRVLNAVRFYEVGIPITHDQCASLCPDFGRGS